jgi:hypothetical protein
VARRSSKAEGQLILILLFVAAPVYGISQVLSVTGWVLPLLALAGIVALVVGVRAAKHRERVTSLRSKYPEDIVQRILAGSVWHGQTEAQLIDALGRPAEVDQKVLKTLRREIWKYGRLSAKRFRLRVTIENGYVAGWDQKA